MSDRKDLLMEIQVMPEGHVTWMHKDRLKQLLDVEQKAQRIEELEGALKSIANNSCCGDCQEAKQVARQALDKE